MSTIVAPHVAVQTPSRVVSPRTGLLRLVWKEYRTMRGFWLMLAGLMVLGQWLTAAIWGRPDTIMLIYNLALGAPVFFAVACAATAFAIEREEGTIEFLRAAPVSAHRVLISKLTIAVTGTVAMFAILMPLARLIAGGPLPNEGDWHGMLGLWLVAAIEAIAWGTLFSLLGARPLIAVVLTLVAVSTCDHVLARLNKGPIPGAFEWLAYLRAAPWRSGIALVILGADIYLGLRWLDGGVARRAKRQPAIAKRKPGAENATAQLRTESSALLKPLLAKRDRSTMLGHLLWQQWRQSRSLIAVMLFLSIAVPFLGLKTMAFLGHGVPIISIAVFSTLMGAMVFLPDQEQRRYRFFAEHNVPPRLVWLSRHLIWLAVLSVSILAVCVGWLFAFVDVRALIQEFGIVMDPKRTSFTLPYSPNLTLPPFALGVAIGATGYAIGQFFSMLIRSGVLAAVVAVATGCTVLWVWAYLMNMMGISLWWSVVPIPVALVVATWLRAPDWVAENKRWSARGRLAAVLAIPATAILIAVPLYRANQIPKESPGFDVSDYSARIQADLAEGMATADLYRKASDLLTPPIKGLEVRLLSAALDDRDRAWLKENEPALRILLEASSREKCMFFDPRAPLTWSPMYKQIPLIQLVVLSARQFELNGDLDAALDRDFAAARVVSHLLARSRFFEPEIDFHDVIHEITLWGARKGQTKERIAAAIKRLSALDTSLLRLDDGLKSDYLIALRAVAGESSDVNAIRGRVNTATELIRRNLLPLERERATRLLNILTRIGLVRVQEMQSPEWLRNGNLIGFCVPPFLVGGEPDFFDTWQPQNHAYHEIYAQNRSDEWLKTTAPDLTRVGMNAINAANRLAWFEADRRATIVILAIEEYRLDHGKLPKSLDQLEGEYLDAVPLDPYSGYSYAYFRNGIAVTQQEMDYYTSKMESNADYSQDWRRNQFRSPPVVPNVPGIWSTGAGIRVSTSPRTAIDADLIEKGGKGDLESYYYPRDGAGYLGGFEPVWLNGDWFPIPDKGD